MISRRIVWMLTTVLIFPLTGCWDAHPLDNQGIVMSLGISPSSQKGNLKWTFTFPNVTLSPGSLTSLKRREQYYNITVQAPTFAEALMRVQQQSSRILYLGQLQSFIWPDTLPWQQLWPVVTAINSHGPIPKTFWVMAATPPVHAVMAFVSPQIVAPRTYLAAYFDCTHCQPFMLGQRGWQFWSHAMTPGISPYVPLVNLQQNKPVVSQILVYPPSGRPVLYSQSETKGFGFLSGKIKRAALSLNWHGRSVGLIKLHDSHRISVKKIPGSVMVNETLQVTGFIDQPPQESSSQEVQNHIRRLAQQRILEWCLKAIHRANATKTDPFGYAQSVLWTQGRRTTFLPIQAHITVLVSLKGEGMLR